MKSFLLKFGCFICPVLLAFIAIALMADGGTDPFYLKFTSPQQTSLMVGVSKAEQDLQPAIMNKALAAEFPGIHLYNYSFTLDDSPYGKLYLEAIRKKLHPGTKNGVFIVTVDPFLLSNMTGEPENETQSREYKGILGTTRYLNMKPNFDYLIHTYHGPYLWVLTKKINELRLPGPPPMLLHDDGWLEVTIPMDSASVAGRRKADADRYRKFSLYAYHISGLRKEYLIKTVAFLKEHGDVYLVQLPVHPELAYYYHIFYPGFDNFIDSVANMEQVPYFNFMDSCHRYGYTDGCHMSKQSGAMVSRQLADLIIRYRHLH